jgi:membrane protease YdiL (CAAX protease family)
MKRSGLLTFFFLTYGYTWGVGLLYGVAAAWMTRTFGPASFTNPLIFAAVWSPTIAGFTCALVFGGARGMCDLLGRIFRWRIGVRWYATALFGTAGFALAARYVEAHFTTAPSPPVFDSSKWPSFMWIGLITIVADPGPLGEDIGWRGFAMPRMLARMSPLTTALLLGVIWGVWHVPAFLVPGLPQYVVPIHWFLLAIVSASVVMTWIALHTRGSVIPLIIMHWAINRFSDLGYQGAFYCAMAYLLAALLVIIGTRGRLGPKDAVDTISVRTSALATQ